MPQDTHARPPELPHPNPATLPNRVLLPTDTHALPPHLPHLTPATVSGRVLLPEGDVAFVPERPYLHIGTLRNTLVHSRHDETVRDDEVLAVLHRLGLERLVEENNALHEVVNWDKQLPLGTQQMLVMARVFLSGAQAVVLDHLLSSLTTDDLQKVFSLLRERNVTCFCFGSGEEDPNLFDHVLQILPDATWRMTAKGKPTMTE
jgi:putative ATP-binding cassette transporter